MTIKPDAMHLALFSGDTMKMKSIATTLLSLACLALVQACATPPSQPMRPSSDVVSLGDQALPACHESGLQPETHRCVFTPNEPQDNAIEEHAYRTKVVLEPDWSTKNNLIGVALSGGGARAAAIAMGVLAGLDDLRLLTHVEAGKKRVDLISSVSGGGYSAYYFYSHLLHTADLPVYRGELFQDCVRRFYANGEEKLSNNGKDNESYATRALVEQLNPFMCEPGTYLKIATPTKSSWEGDGKNSQARHQAALRCQQDVFEPGKCSTSVTSRDKVEITNAFLSIFSISLLSAPFHNFANSLFDSGFNFSPSRSVYRRGIDLGYGGLISQGFNPWLSLDDKNAPRNVSILCPKSLGTLSGFGTNSTLHECDERQTQVKPRKWSYADFADTLMRKRQQQNELESKAIEGTPQLLKNHPYWVIQATSAPTRGLAGWLRKGVNNKDSWNNSFEFTPTHFGSRRYGFLRGTPANLEVVDAVVSAAAFSDSSQQEYDNFLMRPFLGMFIHGMNANWGIDIPNYNVSPLRRTLHQITPFPLNTLDAIGTWISERGARRDRMISSFIRLTDGGNNENTAALAMIRRGVQTIVISDGAADDKGTFGDLCQLKRALNPDNEEAASSLPNGTRLYLYIPGLQGFDEECETRGHSNLPEFNLKHWTLKLPLLLGCVQTEKALEPSSRCSSSTPIKSRILIYKPAVTRETLGNHHCKKSNIQHCKVIDYKADSMRQSVLFDGKSMSPCTKNLTDDQMKQCMAALPCEAARLVRNGSKDFPTGEDATFSATVALTANSSGTLYASYRELARHAIHHASDLITDNSEHFHKAQLEQLTTPMKASVGARLTCEMTP